MALNIATTLPGGIAVLKQALANPRVSGLAKTLAIDLDNEDTVRALLGSVSAVLKNAAEPRSFSESSAAFALAFGLVAPGSHVPAMLQAYREIARL